MKDFLKIYRVSFWFKSLLPVLFGNIFLFVLLFDVEPKASLLVALLLFFISSVGFAATGYLLNDLFDRKADAASGKANATLGKPVAEVLLYVMLCLSLALIPWIFLPVNEVITALLILQLVSYLLYSAPPARIKNIPFLSNAADAGYAYVVPLLLVHELIRQLSGNAGNGIWITAMLSALFLVVGLKNIFIHQLDDLENDRKAAVLSTPLYLGTLRSGIFLQVLFVLEVLLALSWLGWMSYQDHRFIAALSVFGLLLVPVIYDHRNVAQRLDRYQLAGLGLNAFYQFYLPVFYLICLCFASRYWIWGLLFFVILFNDAESFRQKRNIFLVFVWGWGLLVKLYYLLRNVVSKAVNYIIYWIFRLFGVDLRAEKKSALSFLREKLQRR